MTSMSNRARLVLAAQQYPRHCFADISVDHDELGRWQYRNELRRQDASSLLPVIDANVLAEGLGSRVGHEIGRKAAELLRKIVRHFHFPALVFGADRPAQHNATTMCGANASELASHDRENLASHYGTNATGGESMTTIVIAWLLLQLPLGVLIGKSIKRMGQ